MGLTEIQFRGDDQLMDVGARCDPMVHPSQKSVETKAAVSCEPMQRLPQCSQQVALYAPSSRAKVQSMV